MKIGDKIQCIKKCGNGFFTGGEKGICIEVPDVDFPGTGRGRFDNGIVCIDFEHFEVIETKSMQATQFLDHAASIMHQRAQQYDKPDGERSMDATVKAFNAITGRDLTESEGWLLMLLLKNVRQWQKPEYHADSAEDSVAYSALLAEALAKGK